MPALSVLHILRTIKERGTISRTDLQTRTGLSWGTITNTTRDLLNRNLIREEGAIQTKAGRKPVCLSINPSTHVLIGLDISPHVLRCIALNLNVVLLDRNHLGGHGARQPMNFMRWAAKITMRSSSAPCFQRWMLVVP